ncbi:uncharacterized protein J7T54_001993 [Emericellopsis cladophorae]|uniref:Uncharacterized protein n=1 Tax=Emericellopsis cladophorae TaxID=2686198 RepID=A0A9P9XY85_9HYPO|nr:uncharacterized protein J7T54_001993 [Emericellopsis cladophorae]KAI6779905.1 hypothetical protein J7T54_001993 [Emericellopsis cladophorae]
MCSGPSLKRVHHHVEGQARPPAEYDMARPRTYADDYPTLSSASVETYNSVFSDTDSLESTNVDDEGEVTKKDGLPAPTDDDIPPVLPQYQADIIDPLVRPSTPDAFSRLFPSLDRLSIRHDDLTPDGNMNLRIDTIVPCTGRRPITVQLFHLRMHDLARREFSLRRYCRDSGREVCNSKRAYAQAPPTSRPGFQRSMSSALHSLKHPFRRSSITSNHAPTGRPSTGSSATTSSWDAASIRSMRMHADSWLSHNPSPPAASSLVPTNSIKLEFSNYARVDVDRMHDRHGTRYGFEWWGHKYAWKRVVDENLDITSFHLLRDGKGHGVAHITPETRSPNQVEAEEWAGGWVPPCFMWISDPKIVDAMTDVADVIVATGLVALVDDSIKARWHVVRPAYKMNRALTCDAHSHRGMAKGVFGGRRSEQHAKTPLRTHRSVSLY